MLRVAIIGMGPIGNRHADMYRLTHWLNWLGCAIFSERADAGSARLGVPAFYTRLRCWRGSSRTWSV